MLIIFFTVITLFLPMLCFSQEMVSVIDDVSRAPVCRAYFIQGQDTIAYTTPQGIVLLPKTSGKIKVVCKDYKSIWVDSDSIPEVIHLKCELEQLEEIVVIGDKDKVKPRKEKLDEDNLLYARKPKDWLGGGAGISIDAIARLFGYKPASERKRKRVKKILDSYDQQTPPTISSHTH